MGLTGFRGRAQTRLSPTVTECWAASATPANGTQSRRSARLPAVLPVFGLVLVLAITLRMWGITWGLPWVFHPDEFHYAAPAQRMVESGDPNPRYFRNPSLLTYLVAGELLVARAAGLALDALTPAGPNAAYLLARLSSALLGTAGVGLVFALGSILFDRRTGLGAALLLAVGFLHVRDSHYGVNDVPATTLLTLSLCGTSLILQKPARRWYLLAGLAGGLATSTKYNMGFFFVPLLVAHWATTRRRPEERGLATLEPLTWAGVAAVVGLLLGTPYALLDPHRFLADFVIEYRIGDAATTGQAQEAVPLLYLTGLVQGFGALPLLLVAVGVGLALRCRRAATLVLLAYPFAYLAFMLSKPLFVARLELPLLPSCSVLAAYAATRLAEHFPVRWRRLGLVGLWLATAAQPLLNDLRHNQLLSRPDTRIVASEWVQANLPAGSHIVTQTYGLRDVSARYRGYTPNVARHRIELFLRGSQPDLLNSFVENEVDYIVISSLTREADLRDPARQVEPARRYLRLYDDLERLAETVATFSPGVGGREVPFHQEDVMTPFWDLPLYERTGPTLRIYALRNVRIEPTP